MSLPLPPVTWTQVLWDPRCLSPGTLRGPPPACSLDARGNTQSKRGSQAPVCGLADPCVSLPLRVCTWPSGCWCSARPASPPDPEPSGKLSVRRSFMGWTGACRMCALLSFPWTPACWPRLGPHHIHGLPLQGGPRHPERGDDGHPLFLWII